MFEVNEIVNFVSTIAFLLYFLRLNAKGKCSQMPKMWIMGMWSLLVSDVATICEGVLLKEFFNYIEHCAFLLAAVFFLIGAYNFKLSK